MANNYGKSKVKLFCNLFWYNYLINMLYVSENEENMSEIADNLFNNINV